MRSDRRDYYQGRSRSYGLTMNNKRKLQAFSTEPMRLSEMATMAEMVEAFNGLLRQQHEFNKRIVEQADAQAGIRGTVVAARQTKRDTRNLNMPSISLDGGRGADCDDPVDDMDIVNLRTLKRLLKCSNLVKILDGCLEFDEMIAAFAGGDDDDDDGGDGGGGVGCAPATFEHRLEIDTGLTSVEQVRVLNEYVFVAGVESSDPTVQSYRIREDGFSLLDSLVLSQEIRRFVLHGQIIYGCRDGADSQNLLSISVRDPWNLAELGSLDVGFAAQGLYAQGGYLYVVGDEIAVVNITNPEEMVKVN